MEITLYRNTILGDYYFNSEKNYGIAIYHKPLPSGTHAEVIAYDENVGIVEEMAGIKLQVPKELFKRTEELIYAGNKEEVKKMIKMLEGIAQAGN